jgi:hypothetical protein
MLELELVQHREPLRAGEIRGLAFFLKLQFLAEGIEEAALDEIDGEVRDIYGDPLATGLLRRVSRCAAAAKGIKDDIAGVAAGGDDALKESKWFLRIVTESFFRSIPDSRNV